jgi:uncharacterized membrane protein YeaQ/YmgE (transglycosylase-associated protein family)
MKSNQKLLQLTIELRDHPLVGLAGFGVGILYAIGALLLERIAQQHESAIMGADLLANLPSFLAAVAGAAVLLWIMVMISARKHRGAVFVIGICLGAVAGFVVNAIARALAG